MPLFGTPDVHKMQAKRDVNGLIKALGYEDTWSGIPKDAANALVDIGADSVEPLKVALRDQKWQARRAAIEILGRVGDPRGIETIQAALKDSQENVRLTALQALKQIGGSHATDAYIGALRDPAKEIRKEAILALESAGWTPGNDESGALYWVSKGNWGKCLEIGIPAVLPLSSALSQNDYRGQREIIGVLGRIGDARAIPPLIDMLRDRETSKAAQDALRRIGKPAVEPLILLLQDTDGTLRLAAVEVLRQIGDPRALEPLQAAMKGSNERTREEIVAALDRLGGEPPMDEKGAAYWVTKGNWKKCIEIGAPAVEPLITKLQNRMENNDEDAMIAIANTLAEIGDPNGLKEILQLFRYKKNLRVQLGGTLARFGVLTVDPMMTLMKDSDEGLRWAAMEAFGKIGAPARAALVQALQDTDGGVRRLAAVALGKIGDPGAVEPLLFALRDTDKNVSYDSAKSLAAIGAPSLDPLLHALLDKDGQVRRYAAIALQDLDDSRAIEPLVLLLKDADHHVRIEAATALDKMGWKPVGKEGNVLGYWVYKKEWDKYVEEGASDKDYISNDLQSGNYPDEAREGIIWALGKTKDPSFVPLLTGLLKDNADDVRISAARVLGNMGDPRAVEPLIAMLLDNSKYDYVRGAAAEALGKLGDNRAVGALISALNNRDPRSSGRNYRCSIVEALGNIHDGNAIAALIAALNDSDDYIVFNAVGELGKIGDASAAIPLGAKLKSDSVSVRKRSEEVLIKIGAPAAEVLVPLLKDDNDYVRMAAERALCRIGDDRAIAPLIPLLKDNNVNVRDSAAKILARLGWKP